MFIIEKLKFNDLLQLSSLASSQISSMTLIAERSSVFFKENYALREQFLLEPLTVTLKLDGYDLDEIKSRVDESGG